MIDYKKIIKNRELRLKIIQCLKYIPDVPYLKMVYWIKTGKRLDLKNPQSYNEKLNWLKVNDIHPEYTRLADKLAVRKYIKDKLGNGYMFGLLGYWRSFDEIDFDRLPNQFVLKCNHDSASVKVIKDKNSLTEKDKKELSEFFSARLNNNFFYIGREYPYKRIRPYIFAEKYMGDSIKDYKFFCFNGEPKILLIVTDRETQNHAQDYFDMDYNWLDITHGHHRSITPPVKPKNFEEMKEIASKLSQGIKHVRIDFYEIDGKIYFGEFTFFSAGGFVLFEPDKWNKQMGDWIEI